MGRGGVHLGFFRFQSVAPRVAPPRVSGLWLAASIQYADVTEEQLIHNAMVVSSGTFGAIGLEDLRSMAVMTYIRTIQSFRKMQAKTDA